MPLAQLPLSVPEPPSDAEIIAGVLGGRRKANEQLYDTLRPVVVATLRRILRERRVDEDLIQTCFEHIVISLIRRKGKVNSLTAWASSICAHVGLDALRRRIRERKLFQPEEENECQLGVSDSAGAWGPERQISARGELRRVQGILGRMRPQYAQVLLLHDVFGCELGEVANIAGVSRSAAQRRLSRARADMLRRAGEGAVSSPQSDGGADANASHPVA